MEYEGPALLGDPRMEVVDKIMVNSNSNNSNLINGPRMDASPIKFAFRDSEGSGD